VTEAIISGSLCEFYLADHRRSNPMATLHFGSGQPFIPSAASGCWKIKKRTTLSKNFAQISKQRAQKLIAKASSDSASKFEILAFVKANEQRAKRFPRSFRFCVPADDEFLLLMKLELYPCSVAFPASYREPLRLPIKPSSPSS